MYVKAKTDGIIRVSQSEDGSENPRILVQAEEDPDKVLLNTKIQKENMFSKQQGSMSYISLDQSPC